MLAFNADVYNGLKFIHIVAAVASVGTGSSVRSRGTRLRRTGTPEQTANLARDVASTPWFVGSSFVVSIRGDSRVLLHAPGLDFTDTSVLLGLLGYAATFVTGMFLIRPTAEKLAAAAASREGPASPTQALIARILADLPALVQVVLLLVILDMVFRTRRAAGHGRRSAFGGSTEPAEHLRFEKGTAREQFEATVRGAR